MFTNSRCMVILAAVGCCLAAVRAPREQYKTFPVHDVTYPMKKAEDPKSGYVVIQANPKGQMFLLSTRVKANYYRAYGICVANNMQLVKVDSDEKNKLIKEIIKYYTKEGPFWMDGIRTSLGSENWEWSNGTPISTFGWDLGGGEPNNAKGNEWCIELYHRDALWNDQSCDERNYFICESGNNNYDMRNLKFNTLSRNEKENNAIPKNYKSE